MSRSPCPNVLLIEDSDDDAFFFRHALKKCGVPCSLFHVSDGGAALSYLEASRNAPDDPTRPRPDLVFLDLKLPTFSGFEILSHLGEHPLKPALDVAVLSGSDHASDVARARSLGATDYLVKPVAVEILRARLQGWVGRQLRAAAAAAQPMSA